MFIENVFRKILNRSQMADVSGSVHTSMEILDRTLMEILDRTLMEILDHTLMDNQRQTLVDGH